MKNKRILDIIKEHKQIKKSCFNETIYKIKNNNIKQIIIKINNL